MEHLGVLPVSLRLCWQLPKVWMWSTRKMRLCEFSKSLLPRMDDRGIFTTTEPKLWPIDSCYEIHGFKKCPWMTFTRPTFLEKAVLRGCVEITHKKRAGKHFILQLAGRLLETVVPSIKNGCLSPPLWPVKQTLWHTVPKAVTHSLPIIISCCHHQFSLTKKLSCNNSSTDRM